MSDHGNLSASLTGRNPNNAARTGRQIRRIMARVAAENGTEPEGSE